MRLVSFFHRLIDKVTTAINPGARSLSRAGKEILAEEKYEILRQMEHCRKNGFVVGITSSGLGYGTWFTSIEEIFCVRNQHIVVLKPFDIWGAQLLRDHLMLDEINSVSPTTQRFVIPVSIQMKIRRVRAFDKYPSNPAQF